MNFISTEELQLLSYAEAEPALLDSEIHFPGGL